MILEQVPTARAALNDQYDIIRELGRGGTALVYLATERSTGIDVAIKVIRSTHSADDETLARFAREAQFATRLDHPNIVPLRAVVDLGSAGMAIIMDHIDGPTLKQVIKEQRPFPLARAERIMRDVACALGAAHGMGIVHRDVKPANIFIAADGRALLADFGLARSMTGDVQVTMTGVAIGTPAYMAPEQIDGTPQDVRGDIYSLGLVAWEMLTGRRPWHGESLYAVLHHQKHEPLPDVRELRTDVPDRLAEVIARSIEKDPDDRWRDTHELVAALDGAPLPRSMTRSSDDDDTVRVVRPVTARPSTVVPPVEDSPPATDQGERAATFASLAQRLAASAGDTAPRRRRTAFAGVALVGVVLAAVAAIAATGFAFAGRGRSDDSSELRGEVAPRPELASSPARVTILMNPASDVAPQVRATATTVPAPTRVAAPTERPTAALTVSRIAPPSPSPDSSSSVSSSSRSPIAPRIDSATAPPNAIPNTRPSALPLVAPRLVSQVSVVAGGMHSCLISSDGRAFCWGYNDRGQLGNGGTARASTPVVIGTDVRFTTVAGGLSHSCAIARGGAAWCWGGNDHGQLGDRSFGSAPAPVRAADGHLFRAIAAGGAHTCGLDTDGIAWCWGAGAHGQLGDSSSRDSAVPVGAGTGATRFMAIAAGWNFTCALAPTGRARCWGENAAGQLGDGTTTDRREPVLVGSGLSFTSIATGSAHACGVTAPGDVYCWGRNAAGQLGDGTTTDRSAPVRVQSTAHFVSVTAGAVHTCAVTGGGEAYCWGQNTYGQLGNGGTVDALQPKSVAGGHAFASVHAFGAHTCAATVSGEAFCWGYNLEGQLGDGTRVHRTRPVYVESPGGQ